MVTCFSQILGSEALKQIGIAEHPKPHFKFSLTSFSEFSVRRETVPSAVENVSKTFWASVGEVLRVTHHRKPK